MANTRGWYFTGPSSMKAAKILEEMGVLKVVGKRGDSGVPDNHLFVMLHGDGIRSGEWHWFVTLKSDLLVGIRPKSKGLRVVTFGREPYEEWVQYEGIVFNLLADFPWREDFELVLKALVAVWGKRVALDWLQTRILTLVDRIIPEIPMRREEPHCSECHGVLPEWRNWGATWRLAFTEGSVTYYAGRDCHGRVKVLYTNPDDQSGMGGATISIRLVDGETVYLVGPWEGTPSKRIVEKLWPGYKLVYGCCTTTPDGLHPHWHFLVPAT